MQTKFIIFSIIAAAVVATIPLALAMSEEEITAAMQSLPDRIEFLEEEVQGLWSWVVLHDNQIQSIFAIVHDHNDEIEEIKERLAALED